MSMKTQLYKPLWAEIKGKTASVTSKQSSHRKHPQALDLLLYMDEKRNYPVLHPPALRQGLGALNLLWVSLLHEGQGKFPVIHIGLLFLSEAHGRWMKQVWVHFHQGPAGRALMLMWFDFEVSLAVATGYPQKDWQAHFSHLIAAYSRYWH